MTIPSAHDALFRAAMANVNVAREFFLSCLPKKLLKKLNLNVLKLCPQTYIDKHLIWAKPFTLVNVKDIPDEEVRNNKWSGILTFFMKHAVARDFLLLLKPVIDVLREIEEAGGDDYVLLLLNYALSTTEASDLESFVEMVKSGVSQPAGEKIMTLAEQLMARGEQRGIEKGLYQGMRQGEHNLFMRQLKKKFFAIPEKYLNCIDEADEEDLLLWGERLIVASTLQDIFEDE